MKTIWSCNVTMVAGKHVTLLTSEWFYTLWHGWSSREFDKTEMSIIGSGLPTCNMIAYKIMQDLMQLEE